MNQKFTNFNNKKIVRKNTRASSSTEKKKYRVRTRHHQTKFTHD